MLKPKHTIDPVLLTATNYAKPMPGKFNQTLNGKKDDSSGRRTICKWEDFDVSAQPLRVADRVFFE
jgi:hypothetical protein